MSLKLKLFLSYFFLIILFSIALLWFIVEIRELTTSLRGHVRQDIHSVIHVSGQLQYLEDVNSAYIILFIPGSLPVREKITSLNKTLAEYSANWQKLNRALHITYHSPWYDKWLNQLYHFVYGLLADKQTFGYSQEIKQLANRVDSQWRETKESIDQTLYYIRGQRLDDAAYVRDTKVRTQIKQLRKSLTQLNKIIGERGIKRYNEMARIAQRTQWGVMATEVTIVLVTLVIALLGAHKLTRPIHDLKTAVNRMAMEDYDVKLKNKPNDEIGELGTAFEQLSTRLNEAGAYKGAMLSQFTHEMKSPLGSIKQATRLLEQSLGDNINKQQSRFLSIIKGNNENLQRLITNILHSTTYDSQKLKLNYSRTNLVKLITEVLIYLSPTIKEKNIKVDLHFSSKNVEAELDVDKWKEVIQNLMNNAIKFSPEAGQIDITLKEKFPVILMRIKDRGIGIPQKEIPFIFEKLYRASNSRKISVKGTGLGLYIVSQIVRAHGGQITVDSQEGESTTFNIKLPRSKNVAEEGGWLT
ncbi:MAG: HAMP domain-containing protein [Caldithrix sp.]|nr:HAMP domain-containing protein [Caldithrix sp.]